MSRKTYAVALTVLIIAFILIPGVHADPIENMVVVQPLPDSMVAGNSYEMVITFDNVAQESVSLIVEITVTCMESPLNEGEVFVDEVKLNEGEFFKDIKEIGSGFFRTEEGTIEAESSNELRITVSSKINLMPGTYDFDIVLGSEVEPEPEPETGTLSISTTPVDGEVIVNGDSWGIAPAPRVVDVGKYMVTFGDMAGYTKPDPVSATVVASETKAVVGTYIWIQPVIGPSYAGGTSNKKPIADAGPDQGVYVDDTVYFDGSGSDDPDGFIMSWSWSFGDGEKASGETASHTYSEPGVYTVTLTVKDSRSAEASDTCIVTVTEETEPEPLIVPPLTPILSNLTITPEEIELGEEVTINFMITNIDSQPINYTVTMQIEGRRGDLPVVVYVELEAYESTLVSQTITPVTVGDHDVTVDGLEGSYTVNPVPIVLEPAEFIISGLMVSPTMVPTGDPVTVRVTVTNIGELTGTHTLEIEIDGDTPEGPPIETVLEGGASKTVTITVTEEEPREHTVKVDGLTEVFTVTAPPGFVWTPGYIAGILILILIAGTTIYTLYRGGRLSLPKSPPGSENLGD